MAISLIQTVLGSNAVTTTLGTAFGTFPSNLTTGNTVILTIGCGRNGTDSISSITDNLSNTYNRLVAGSESHSSAYIYSADNITGGAGTLTVVFKASINSCAFVAREYSGLAAPSFDVGTWQPTSSAATTHIAGTTATTVQSNELIVIGITCTDGGTFTFAPSTGFGNGTAGTSNTSTHNSKIFVSDQIVSATGAYVGTPTTSSSQNSSNAIATFKDNGGGAATTAPISWRNLLGVGI